eukprot:3720167-Ditylum_brightwellii.AAC.1
MAQLYITSFNTNVASCIKNIQHRGEAKQSFAPLRPVSKGQQGEAVNTIIALEQVTCDTMYSGVIDSLNFDPPWKEIDNQGEVMSHLLLWKKLHLHQVFNILLASGPLKDYIGEHRMGEGARSILERNFDPNVEVNLPAVIHWLKFHLRWVAPPNSISEDLTLD